MMYILLKLRYPLLKKVLLSPQVGYVSSLEGRCSMRYLFCLGQDLRPFAGGQSGGFVKLGHSR